MIVTNVYLAGPMRGYAQYNFPAFDAGTLKLREMGFEVFSPAERDRNEVDFDPVDMTGFEDLAAEGFSLRDALGVDLDYICRQADAVVVLPGWDASAGAKAEVTTATALGLPVYELDDLVKNGLLGAIDLTKTTVEEVRVTSESGGQKGQKQAQMGAIDPVARNELALVAGFGTEKYSRGNYLLGFDWSLLIDAAHRHLAAFEAGENLDPESGLCHAAHAAWQCLALVSFYKRELGNDDRYERVG